MDETSGSSRLQVEEITQIVLDVVSRWQGASRKPPNRVSRSLDWLSSHWMLVLAVVAILSATGARIYYGVSLLHPLQEMAHKQEEYRANAERRTEEQAKRDFDQRMHQQQLALGRALLSIGEYEGAKDAFNDALKHNAASVEARRGLLKAGMYDLMQGEYRPEVIERRIALLQSENRDDAHAHVFLGDLYLTVDDAKAAHHYEKALGRDPALATAHYGLGFLLHKQREHAAAIDHLRKATQLSTWNVRYLTNLARLLFETGAHEEAEKTYNRVLRLDPDYLPPYLDVGYLAHAMGKPADAVGHHDLAVRLLEDQSVTTLEKNKGFWYYVTDQEEPIYLADLPNKRCYGYYSLSVTFQLLGRGDEAARYLRKARSVKGADHDRVRELVAFDLKQLAKFQPALADSLARYQKFL